MGALRWQLRKILFTKTRLPGGWFTFQELLNIACYAVISLSLLSFKSVVDAPLSPSPSPRPLPLSLTPSLCTLRPAILYAPAQPHTDALAQASASLLSTTNATCYVLGFASADALYAAFLAQPSLQGVAMAALLFNRVNATSSVEQLGDYTIAMSRDLISADSTRQRDFEWPTEPQLGTRSLTYSGHNDEDSTFLTSGFISIQWAVDRAIAAVAAGTTAANVTASSGVQVTRFPLLPFSSTYSPDSSLLLGFLLPVFACVPPFTMSMLLTQFMLNEK
eukprot:scaffold325148_cov61-Tisochrysis_lutea.AAC.1